MPNVFLLLFLLCRNSRGVLFYFLREKAPGPSSSFPLGLAHLGRPIQQPSRESRPSFRPFLFCSFAALRGPPVIPSSPSPSPPFPRRQRKQREGRGRRGAPPQ